MTAARLNLFFILALTSFSFANSQTVNSKTRNGFVAWEQYLQECGAEVPYQCTGTRRALNQTCMFDSDCMTPATCQKAKCLCPKGFVTFRERCVKAPTLDQPCLDGQCDTPLICTRRETCDCPPPMDRIENGCDAKCPVDNVLVDGACLPYVRLNGDCKSSLQCNTAYAYCNNAGKCHCIRGTQAGTDRCIANPTCPDGGDILKRGSELVKCNTQICPTNQLITQPTRLKLDTCPDAHYCVFPSYQDADGFCCPEKPYCPIGDPWKGKNCENPRSEAERCPPETHHCYAAIRGTFCCPLPCPSFGPRGSVVVFQGTCYERKKLHEKCTISAQCPTPAECLPINLTSTLPTINTVNPAAPLTMTMTCRCPDGFALQYGPFGERCQKQCGPGEVLVGTDCLQMVLPTHKCTTSAQCTSSTKCIAGICDCPCGTISYNGRCVDKPECPDFGNGVYDALTTPKGTLMECSPNSVYNPFAPPPCPDKSFCHRAMVYSGGICCPLPEPMCQDGRAPPKGRDSEPILCDLSNLATGVVCPRNLFCFDYTRSARIVPSVAQNPGRRGVCCPLDSTLPFQPNLFPQPTPPQTQPPWPIGNDPLKSQAQNGCPTGHRAKLFTNGQPMVCSYYAYNGQCGTDASCFLNPVPSARIQGAEGICCTWR